MDHISCDLSLNSWPRTFQFPRRKNSWIAVIERRGCHTKAKLSRRDASHRCTTTTALNLCVVTFSVHVTLPWLHSNVKVDRRKFRVALRSLAANERAQPVHYSKVVRRSHATPPYRRRSRRLILAVFLLLS